MSYIVTQQDYKTWDESKDGNLMYNIFDICKVCKGKLRGEPYKAKYNYDRLPVDVPYPICIKCQRDDKIEELWI